MIQYRKACAVGVVAICTFTAPGAIAGEVGFVSKISGKGVSLSRGQEQVPARVQTLLESGDRVKAADGSFVDVIYLADGCVLRIEAGKSVVLPSSSPCALDAEDKTANITPQPAESDVKVVPAAAEEDIARISEYSGPLARANLGQGLVDVSSGLPLKVGDTVFAGQSTSVTLYFVKSNCSYTLEPETYLRIEATAPCETSATPPKPAAQGMGLALGAIAILGGGAAAVFLLTSGEEEEDNNNGGGSVTPN